MDGAIDCVSEALDENVISPYLGPILLDEFLHMFLPGPQVVYNITQVRVDLVVMLEVLIHFVSLLLETGDLHLSGCDVAFELLDFVVKHELELLELLRLLFQLIDLLFSITNQLILSRDLCSLILYFFLEALKDLLLVGHLDVFLLFVSLKLFDIALEVLVLVFGKLKLSLALEGHILNLGLVLHVLLVDLIDLKLGISLNLSEGLVIVLTNLSDVVAKLLSCVFGCLHILAELF